MSIAARSVACALVFVCSSRVASADKDISFESKGERSTTTRILLGSLLGAGVIAGGLGVYWHLDSKSASDDVGAVTFTGKAWTAEDVALVDQADRSRTRAAVAYGIGGALVLGAIIAFIATDPPTETVVITPRRGTPTLTPTDGGATLGGTWSF
ncbi:MAG: hypothetical protein JWP01_377 [Myxococcales bacterium]|nr:hypothetical protein [Myxococcales bacterium]